MIDVAALSCFLFLQRTTAKLLKGKYPEVSIDSVNKAYIFAIVGLLAYLNIMIRYHDFGIMDMLWEMLLDQSNFGVCGQKYSFFDFVDRIKTY